MAITINGNGTITGISAGGLPDGSVDADTLASGLATQNLQEVDQWRLSSTLALTASWAVISANLERQDNTFSTHIGTGMSQSSGVFTFPSTGIYFIEFTSNYMINGQTGYSNVFVKLTTDNSSYNTVANSSSAIGNLSTDSYLSLSTGVTVDITNVSTHKVRFGVGGQASVLWRGDSGRNETFVTFLKLGAT